MEIPFLPPRPVLQFKHLPFAGSRWRGGFGWALKLFGHHNLSELQGKTFSDHLLS